MTPEADLLVRKHQRMCIQAPAMFDLLEDLQWRDGYECDGAIECSVCLGPWPTHEPDCRLNAILKAVRGEDA